MRLTELLLPKGVTDRSLGPELARYVDGLQKRIDRYVDALNKPGMSKTGKDFLKAKLRDDYAELRELVPGVQTVAEAVHKLPITNDEFDVVKAMMAKPIPAAVAPIYIMEIIEDDDLNATLLELEDSNPGMDVRPIIAEWFDRVMPDQRYRFTDEERTPAQRNGVLSPIHGYDDHQYKGTNDPLTGNAYGAF
jgi:hypothetical protein